MRDHHSKNRCSYPLRALSTGSFLRNSPLREHSGGSSSPLLDAKLGGEAAYNIARRSGRSTSLMLLLQQMLAHELHRAVKLVVGIFLFREAVSLVVGEEIPDRGVLFF